MVSLLSALITGTGFVSVTADRPAVAGAERPATVVLPAALGARALPEPAELRRFEPPRKRLRATGRPEGPAAAPAGSPSGVPALPPAPLYSPPSLAPRSPRATPSSQRDPPGAATGA